MSEEGKFSRAMSKAGGADKLSERSERPLGVPGRGSADVRDAPPGTGGCRPVAGRAGEPLETVVMVRDRRGEAASQIRHVRARLLAMNNGNPPRVISVSSGTREEGKSTLVLNLGAALAEVDPGRVAVVDGDVRGPSLSRLANVDAQVGLREILTDNLSLEGRIYETAVPRLDIVPCLAGDPAEYEGSLVQHCEQLLAKLRTLYSFVIVDTPPVMKSSQACTFAKHSDGVILVARLERTPREVVKRAADELRNAGGNVLGCVLTDRKHHVPRLIYRFFGTPSDYYYRYGRRGSGPGKPPAPAEERGGGAPEA